MHIDLRNARGGPNVGPPARTLGILTSFPPTECGIATFSAALTAGLLASGATVDVVRTGITPVVEDPSVLASLEDGAAHQAAAVEVLNRADVVIVQHEYGLYDGPDGAALLDVMAALRVPCVVVAHTVLQAPTRNQRLVLEAVCEAADMVVVMTASAHDRLVSRYGVPASSIRVIPHGAAVPLRDPLPASAADDGRPPLLLSWGLLGPGKGIEWAIDAVAMLGDLTPRPEHAKDAGASPRTGAEKGGRRQPPALTYLVAGATHPKVVAHAGEAYRNMLVQRAADAGLAEVVRFDGEYRDLASLTTLIGQADLVVLPYDSADQVTSGVLVDAVAAGRPVVSTAFPHAVELLGSGAGLVVPQGDAKAMADAIRSVLTDPDLAAGMAAEARRLAPALSWDAVAARYAQLAEDVLQTAAVRT